MPGAPHPQHPAILEPPHFLNAVGGWGLPPKEAPGHFLRFNKFTECLNLYMLNLVRDAPCRTTVVGGFLCIGEKGVQWVTGVILCDQSPEKPRKARRLMSKQVRHLGSPCFPKCNGTRQELWLSTLTSPTLSSIPSRSCRGMGTSRNHGLPLKVALLSSIRQEQSLV